MQRRDGVSEPLAGRRPSGRPAYGAAASFNTAGVCYRRGSRRTSGPGETGGDKGGQSEAALFGHGGGELLFGEIGGAIARRVVAGFEPVAGALADGMQHLTEQQRFELLRGFVDSGRVVRLAGR